MSAPVEQFRTFLWRAGLCAVAYVVVSISLEAWLSHGHHPFVCLRRIVGVQ